MVDQTGTLEDNISRRMICRRCLKIVTVRKEEKEDLVGLMIHLIDKVSAEA
jgi:hypothetical protein